jgi:hypothetical protein
VIVDLFDTHVSPRPLEITELLHYKIIGRIGARRRAEIQVQANLIRGARIDFTHLAWRILMITNRDYSEVVEKFEAPNETVEFHCAASDPKYSRFIDTHFSLLMVIGTTGLLAVSRPFGFGQPGRRLLVALQHDQQPGL